VEKLFHPLVREWFERRFGTPTQAQALGWPAIARGRHTLISAPTGSGKTLAAFLICLDRLIKAALDGTLGDVAQAVYVSPLKALSNDVHTNLQVPLDEIRATLDIMEKAVDEDATLGIWIQNLLIHVCRGFDCTHIIAKRKEGTKVIFIGDEADAEIAASTFEFLKREIRRLCSESLPLLVKQLGRKWTPRQLEESYLEGAVHRIGEKLQKRIDQIKKTEAEKCTALVLMKEDMLEEYLEKSPPYEG